MTRRWYDPLTGAPGQPGATEDWDGPDATTRQVNARSDRPALAGAIVDELIARRNWRERLEGAHIHKVWPRVAGEAVAEHVQPVRLHGGVLVLQADSGTWATQVRYLQQRLIERANEELGEPLVQHIRITSTARKR